ncbi:hypothetical protein [Chryseobacterium sp.]|uniref:hypothetical protein n=1 Tax=Chryseobacterium sp. TaxID=1871047 RepID=UPI0011CCADBE|nr:hypothetical protein [Chryseobacterium sp.]TXF75060.1 hypothetical protein FUA25_12355 [Chryseobacterium sp.]
MKKLENWVHNPSKKTVIIFSTLSVIGITLNLLAMSDLFTETVFQSKYLMMWFIMVANVFVVATICINYFNKRRQENFKRN